MAKAALIVSGGIVLDAILVPDEASVIGNGARLAWSEGDASDGLDAPEGATFVLDEHAGIGWAWSGTGFEAPLVEVPPAAPQRRFSFLEFMDLFTEEEQMTLVEASMTLPAVKLWYDKALGAQYIDLDDPRTEPGLQKLVDENLISTERKATVMVGQAPA
ncbi:hypothetical protein [Microvirga sp. P5_D2]